ncbi:MAG TPA: protein kinase [Gemmataceae bacterium]|nr:protein kinase [Gemmataceae bacterium]
MTDLPAELASHSTYDIIRELGRGGMGVVYLAYNRVLARQEVLKVVSKTLIDQAGGKSRFLREMQSAAQLNHPNVVKAHTAVLDGERLLAFAMEYIDGEDLDKAVKARGRPLAVVNACYYIQQAAKGLQHAFEKGMVHRDIKPQNLIRSIEGKTHVVKVLDFGLAKLMREKGESGGLTDTGQMLGTPDYVAPEQAKDAAHADIRADIYSLGCTLYYLLTGSPPFKAGNYYEVLKAHELTEAQPVHLVRPEVPEELAGVVRKMMAKDPADRYQTPSEVAQALAVFVKPKGKQTTGKPSDYPRTDDQTAAGGGREKNEVKGQATADTGVRGPWDTLTESRISPAEPVSGADVRKRRSSAMKNKWMIGGGVATCLLLMGLVGLFASFVLVKTKNGTIKLEDLPSDAEVLVDGDTATVKWDGKNAEITIKPGTHEIVAKVNGIEVIAAQKITIKEGGREWLTAKVVPQPHGEGPTPVLPKPGGGGRGGLSGGRSGGSMPKPIPDGRGFVPLFSGTGRWRIDGTELVQEAHVPDARLWFGDAQWTDYDFAFEAMKVSGFGAFGAILRATNATQVSFFTLGGWGNTFHELHTTKPDVSLHKIGGRVERSKWYKVEVKVRGQHYECFLDGRRILEGIEAEHPCGQVGFRTSLAAVRFRNFEVKDPMGNVLLKDFPNIPTQTGPERSAEILCFVEHEGPVTSTAFSPDGRLILSASNGEHNIVDLQGKGWFWGGLGSTLRLWDAATGKQLDCSKLDPAVWPNWGYLGAIVSSDGKQALSCSTDRRTRDPVRKIHLWNIKDGKIQHSYHFPENTQGALRMAFSPDGKRAFAGGVNGTLWEWDLSQLLLSRHLPGSMKGVTAVAFSPDTRHALFGKNGQPLSLIDVASGKELADWPEQTGIVRSISFSPDGHLALTGSSDTTIRLWDVASGRHLHCFQGHQAGVWCLAFSPDGSRFLSGGFDTTVRLWHVETRRELVCFTGHDQGVRCVAFSPDGQQAASGSDDTTIRLWPLPKADQAEKGK